MSLNVRLSEEEARMAAELRRAGVQISGLVREAIRTEYERRVLSRRSARPSSVVRGIIADLPDPPDLPPRDFSITDRRAVRRDIERRLRRGRR